jgi:hypothetical protein
MPFRDAWVAKLRMFVPTYSNLSVIAILCALGELDLLRHYLMPAYTKICFYMSSPDKNRQKTFIIISLYVGLAKTWHPAMTIYSPLVTVYPPPIFSPSWYERTPSPLSSHCPVGGVLMVRSDYKIWVQTQDSSVLTCCHMGQLLTVVLTSSSSSATNLTSSSSPGKRVSCFFRLNCQFTYSLNHWAV